MPQISIIVPVHNVEKYLAKCIESILQQTFNDFELFLINDHSKDNSLEICKEYEKKDNRIKVIDNKLYGVSEARNTGIDNSTGEWIIFVDSDDWIEKNMLEVLITKATTSSAEIIMCGAYINFKNCRIKNRFYPQNYTFFSEKDKEILQIQAITRIFRENFRPKNMSCGVPWSKLYKKSFIQKNELRFNPKLIRMQDMIFNLYAFQFANSIEYIDLNLYNYRKNLNSACGTYDRTIYKKEKAALEELDIFIQKHKSNSLTWKDVYTKKMFDGFIYRILKQDILNKYNRETLLQKRKRMLKLLKEDYKDCLNNIKKECLNSYQRKHLFLLKHHLVSLYIISNWLIEVRNKEEFFD